MKRIDYRENISGTEGLPSTFLKHVDRQFGDCGKWHFYIEKERNMKALLLPLLVLYITGFYRLLVTDDLLTGLGCLGGGLLIMVLLKQHYPGKTSRICFFEDCIVYQAMKSKQCDWQDLKLYEKRVVQQKRNKPRDTDLILTLKCPGFEYEVSLDQHGLQPAHALRHFLRERLIQSSGKTTDAAFRQGAELDFDAVKVVSGKLQFFGKVLAMDEIAEARSLPQAGQLCLALVSNAGITYCVDSSRISNLCLLQKLIEKNCNLSFEEPPLNWMDPQAAAMIDRREEAQELHAQRRVAAETEHEEDSSGNGLVKAGIGLFLCLLGIVVTVASFNAAKPGGSYIVTHGLIVYGIIMFIQGLIKAGRGK